MTRSVIGKGGRMWHPLRKEVHQLLTFFGCWGVDIAVAFVVGTCFLLEDHDKAFA